MLNVSGETLLDARGVFFGIIDSAMDAIISFDAAQRVVLVNQAALRTFGYEASQVMGQPLSMFLPERFRAGHAQHVAHFGHTGVAKRSMGALGVLYGLRANGEEFPIEASISSTRHGDATIHTVILRDISRRVDDEHKISMLTRTYSALSRTNQALLECTQEQALFDQVCRIAVEAGGMERAWIGKLDETGAVVRAVSACGDGCAGLAGREIRLAGNGAPGPDAPGYGALARACREGRAVLGHDGLVPGADPLLSPDGLLDPAAPLEPDGLVDPAAPLDPNGFVDPAAPLETNRRAAWGASAIFPILLDGRTHAVLSLYHGREDAFTHEAISLMQEMAANVGHGLRRFALEAERQQARESSRLAALIYQSSAEAVMVTDEENRIIDVNPAFTALTGYTLEDVRGRSPRILRSGRHDRAFYRDMWRSVIEQGHWQGEVCDRRKDGALQVKLVNISVIRDDSGRIHRHVAQFFDITERKQKEELIWKQANYDMLTGLPNRRLFLDRLEQEIKKVNRSGQPLALLFLDLDRFKEVNDTLGHAKGDELLVEAARRIAGQLRDTDTVARLGGDEFMIILTEVSERLHLEHIAHSINQALSDPFHLGEGNVAYVSASIGIALYPDDASEVEALFRDADQAMYSAKTQGRNRFNYFTRSMQHEAHEKLALTNDLRHALARAELEVYYQPIVDMADGRIVKAEALLRWHHPARGMISPEVFVPLAEESGLIIEIGEWVFEQAIASILRWREVCGHIVPVSVNKSPVQFDKAVRHPWMDKLARANLPARSINVEITERLLIKDSQQVKLRLAEFRNRGVEVSVDDFGTGFSSLAYLMQFDIDYLKIDRAFVSQLADSGSNQALTEAIIQMAHKLGIRTIAEGVETAAQRDLLAALGCDFMQGYLYAPPLPAHAFEQLLQAGAARAPAGAPERTPEGAAHDAGAALAPARIAPVPVASADAAGAG